MSVVSIPNGEFSQGEVTGDFAASEIATKLFCHETIFNFHMNNFDTIIENMKNKVITFKNAKQTENKN